MYIFFVLLSLLPYTLTQTYACPPPFGDDVEGVPGHIAVNDTVVNTDTLSHTSIDDFANVRIGENHGMSFGGHRIELNVCPSLIFHTNRFLRGDNPEQRIMNHDFTYKLKYAFVLSPQNTGTAYPECYQGVGMAYHDFNVQLGNPLSVFLFQGARIATLTPKLTLNYEWNLGLAMGWNPYDPIANSSNRIIGSKVTAYINTNLYLSWIVSRNIDLNIGVSLSHYSNGNTKIPNAGLNTGGANIGLAYYIDRQQLPAIRPLRTASSAKYMTYDLMLFGSWRAKGFYTESGPMALPGTYAVCGFNFSPMYNLSPMFKAGISFDGSYDQSANIKSENDRLSVWRQMSLGLSARAEFVMPYFTIVAGLGTNIINSKGDLGGLYQVLALKVAVARPVFLHIGYTLHDLKTPNYLMLGLGYRFGIKH
ncbi:MAG: acyloxyacyl hydrolase [Bacteroides sp.]|nr:acyloxyacyl hydrolase [Roseburia sp.]MCM1345686.1 acyloxyacyl hydrolase [Bacteroides sp.]MCM1419786.1 acyloxyacyl hydrolase [Bacteroides sp.]